MKYCGECGNQLLDEAVRCPKCGASVTPAENESDKLIRADSGKHLKTGAALNNLAGICNLLLVAFFGWVLFGGSSVESGVEEGSISMDFSGGAPHPALFWLWIAAVLFTYALGLYAVRRLRRGRGKAFVYLYMVAAILSVIVMNLAFPNALYFAFCFIGVVFFVPLILQLIAGVKMLQGSR